MLVIITSLYSIEASWWTNMEVFIRAGQSHEGPVEATPSRPRSRHHEMEPTWTGDTTLSPSVPKDLAGNVGSASTIVTVPHDLWN